MTKEIKFLVAVTVFFTLLGCSDAGKDSDLPNYRIIEDEVNGNIKRTVEVELHSRTDAENLELLAERIYGLSNVDVERTFIGYRIAGSHKNQSYWATTHYNPTLEINIIGESASDHKKIENAPLVDGEVLGVWIAHWGYEYKVTAYEQEDKTYIRSTFGDGSSSDEAYDRSQSDRGIKLQSESGEERGEHFIINHKGDLEFWSKNGNYYTAPKI
ncbi:hypothetical protein MHM95_06190 [Pseudoalteromonas sp. CnMc7-15]|uniref:hypothetical protein n=1 Tax=unclassified Pseudoalteromonas TaxID=194690 RepID=UPI001EF628B6|nr:hypothetical protein [Pseudoalteromonas sp. CnMc7-15]MCG7565876.1 hypothetical protein [Pseudoalteromonas sp. CnMc7-15]